MKSRTYKTSSYSPTTKAEENIRTRYMNGKWERIDPNTYEVLETATDIGLVNCILYRDRNVGHLVKVVTGPRKGWWGKVQE